MLVLLSSSASSCTKSLITRQAAASEQHSASMASDYNAISFLLLQVYLHVYLGFGDQLEMNVAGQRNRLIICPTWWSILFVNRLFGIRSAVVNRLLKNGKSVWKQLPNSLRLLLHLRTMVEKKSLYVNDGLKTCAPLTNIRQKYSTRRPVVVRLDKRSQACRPTDQSL